MGGKDCDEYICSNDKEEQQLKEIFNKPSGLQGNSGGPTQIQSIMKEKPLNAIELGRSTWPLLHRLSLSYPQQPTEKDKEKAITLIQTFSKLYPCKICANDFQGELKKSPPALESREKFAIWMCEQHNIVNRKLGKPEFKCIMRRIELTHGTPQRKEWTSIL
ncbi:hypothetical protein FGO68_gene7882 [Halteria grandinella]|uniref:Sulfhydryl oxidase n=1 Tax=Halteria grandinella TaxID=5974 RepID=A0A8J8NBQ4_HALGN|nr:hypothetical protein FGO68_gene7882 [Halteria grandinella]